ncbi:MAG: glycoside hydrolase [Phycisphaerae bacterium]|nr:glycoside hydrolase [Phycisphaerae bacterium]
MPSEPLILDAQDFKHHVDRFNTMEDEPVVNAIPNARAWSWMQANVPLFECSDKDLEEIYYYRWWTYRKHIKDTPDGRVLTEFITPVNHAGPYNTISCALGHHLNEGRWLQDQGLLNEYVLFWLRGRHGGPQSHLHKFSSWLPSALYSRYLVNHDASFLKDLLPDLVKDYEQWETERQLPNGLFWQYDVKDGMEESISGGRRAKNIRPTINSYMIANAQAITAIANMAGQPDLAQTYRQKAETLKGLMLKTLWDAEAQFFKVQFENGQLSDAREAIGYIPWMFNLPEDRHAPAWQQILDPKGFAAPYGLTTAEQRHPKFRTHGTGTCEWDGAVWPFATSQTLMALANVLKFSDQSFVSKQDYFNALLTYARAQHKNGRPYIGEYQDEQTGVWLKGDNPRSRAYNHSTFCDLIISGLIGLCAQSDDTIIIDPLIPANTWDWFALDRIPYHGQSLTILWDRTGEKYLKGKGFSVFVNGQLAAHCPALDKIKGSVNR